MTAVSGCSLSSRRPSAPLVRQFDLIRRVQVGSDGLENFSVVVRRKDARVI